MTADLASTVLYDASVRVILAGQSSSGAYVASPHFSQYGFGWLRDGAYCALAMDAAGERDSSEAFHAWVAAVINGQADAIRDIVVSLAAGEDAVPERMLPTRYTLDGARESLHDEDWPNFQLDGYGTWLFALAKHLDGPPNAAMASAVELAAEYLVATWSLPCFDYWEEYGDRVHTSTLAAIAAGLRAAAGILGRGDLSVAADRVVATIVSSCVSGGTFVKGPDDARVDASLLSLATPFAIVDAADPIMVATVARIRAELSSPSGGIRRYLGDTYYGGSPWMLLTAWLGWHLREAGDQAGYESARTWVEQRAGHEGWMAEQITDEPQDPSWVEPWVRRWGAVANPLLWSHAKYLLMEAAR